MASLCEDHQAFYARNDYAGKYLLQSSPAGVCQVRVRVTQRDGGRAYNTFEVQTDADVIASLDFKL